MFIFNISVEKKTKSEQIIIGSYLITAPTIIVIIIMMSPYKRNTNTYSLTPAQYRPLHNGSAGNSLPAFFMHLHYILPSEVFYFNISLLILCCPEFIIFFHLITLARCLHFDLVFVHFTICSCVYVALPVLG